MAMSATDRVIGVALGPDVLVIAGDGRRMPLAFESGANGARESLAVALRTLPAGAPAMAVALLPPLAEVRAIAMPPLSGDERDRFLTRNAARYFLGARGPQQVGSDVAVGGDGANVTMAAAASQVVMTAVELAAADAGRALQHAVPAEAAWVAAALAAWPAFGTGVAHVLVARDARAELLSMSNGALAGVRRFRNDSDAAHVARAVGRDAPVGVLGAPSLASAWVRALAAQGVTARVADGRSAADADALAARYAMDAVALRIRSDEAREADRRAVRRSAWLTAAAAAGLLLAAALVHTLGIRRELASVRAERAAIRPQVEATLAGRTSVDAAYRDVSALAAAAAKAPRWSQVLSAVTGGLRDDASLTAFRARGDSIFLDGVAERAAPIFDDLARVAGVSGVRATAPVRREAAEGEQPLEHFSIGARVVTAGAAKAGAR
jgi:hypothetical protein